jgi:hypothetical protein
MYVLISVNIMLAVTVPLSEMRIQGITCSSDRTPDSNIVVTVRLTTYSKAALHSNNNTTFVQL